MRKIYLLTDYKGFFGSKHNAVPYRSGMDKKLLEKYFGERGFETNFIQFTDICFRKMDFKGQFVLYTSSEDKGDHYKDFIEDIVLGLELQGAFVIPSFKYLRAHNNKILMEILRDQSALTTIKNIKSFHFGTLEEFVQKVEKIKTPSVIKSAKGAMSRNVLLAKNKKDLYKNCKKISRTKHLYHELWDYGRSIRRKGYKMESTQRKKFIIQNLVPNLENDWKIYVFGEKYYIFYRPILRKNDFRASGGGYDNYYYNDDMPTPDGILGFAKDIFKNLNTPNISLDIAYDGSEFYLLEFQCIYFGTAGIIYSDYYYHFNNKRWEKVYKKLDIEKVYVESIVEYINGYLK